MTGLKPHQLLRKGIALVPEGRAILSTMTVLENLEMGAYHRKDGNVKEDIKQVMKRFPILEERQTQLAGTLSGGQQQMLAIARALLSKPKLLLLDEPSMGLAPIIVSEIFRIIQEIKEEGTTVLVVEQNAKQALKIADYGYVMETGKIIMEGFAKICSKMSGSLKRIWGKRKRRYKKWSFSSLKEKEKLRHVIEG